MRGWFIGLILLTCAPQAWAASPVVVELFTSQGCSSCPPADAALRDLARRPDVLALGFHVTYWNGLGWRDPFSLDAATQRQKDYQRALGVETVYTPQIVVQGQAEMVGSDRPAVEAAIATARAAADGPMVRLERAASGGLRVDIGVGQGTATVLLVGYDPRHVTPVGRGENEGRTLEEANVVRSLRPIGSWNGAPVALTSPLPPGERTAILLQAQDGRIIAAGPQEVKGAP
jgi:hypothetical protein